jgi:predicted porin
MKKSLIALAVLAASGAAMAQSSVTMFGVVDAAVTYGSGSVANRTSMTNSGHTASRLGFRGVEDLGGGLKAGFHLEAGINNDDGSGAATSLNNQTSTVAGGLTFNRRSTVSLMGNFGEVRLGRDYTPQFWNTASFDPFGYNGVGATVVRQATLGGPTAVRASNSIAYHAPANLGGFYGSAMYSMGENASNAANKKDGNGLGLRVGYAKGPIDVALAYSETKFLAGDIKALNLGGSYDLGMAKIMAMYVQDKNSNAASNDGKGYQIGGVIPVGAGEVRLTYGTYKRETPIGADPKVNKLALGYVHNLSKRTALYATYAHLSNKNGASFALGGAIGAANENSNGYDFGIKHSF